MAVASQFVQVGERRVLVRYAGAGPALVLLHQSPQSSAALLPWFEAFAGRFAVFAPDTPGFGRSDPLPLAQPSIPDLARALGDLLQALGLQKVLLYGVHTGAAITLRLAQDQPERVAALVCDGLALFTAEERQPLLDGYLPPFEPRWDGGHLLWLWARVREQTLFFPWHVGTSAARLADYPLLPPEALHADVMDLLAAGDGYRAGYRAPLLYEHSRLGASRLSVPARLLYRRSDVLRPHLERLGSLPVNVQAQEVADAPALGAQMAAHFDAFAAAASTTDAAQAVAQASSPRHCRVPLPAGALAFLRTPSANACVDADVDAGAATELFLPDIGTPATWPPDAAPGHQSLVLEWPGHGASDRRAAADVSLQTLAKDLVQALAAPELAVSGPLRLRAQGGGCALAAVLAHALGPRCTGLVLQQPMPLNPAERDWFLASLPDWQPVATGAHLIAAWNWARLQHLFCPWLAPDAAAALRAPAPPPRRVHADALEMLRAGPGLASLWAAALVADWPALLAVLPCAVQMESGGPPQRAALASRLMQADNATAL